jgi:hypothetical protein
VAWGLGNTEYFYKPELPEENKWKKIFKIKNQQFVYSRNIAGCQRFTPVILAMWEAEIGRIMI